MSMRVRVLAGALRPLNGLQLHLWGWGVSVKLCNFLVYFLPLSIPLWLGEGKNLRSFTKVACILAQGRRGKGKCGEPVRGLLGWQRQGQEPAGHHESLGKGGESPGPLGFRMSSLRALPGGRPREAVSWGLGGISNHLGMFIFRAGGRGLSSKRNAKIPEHGCWEQSQSEQESLVSAASQANPRGLALLLKQK